MALPNIWHLRTVADASSKACYVCYKPTTRVLITPDNKDFFYVCPGHLKDKGFCSPLIDPADEAAKKKHAEIDREIEKIKQEYEEKQRKKKNKAKDKDKDNDKDDKKRNDDDDRAAEKEKDEKIKAIKSGGIEQKSEDIPRIYALHKNFYQMRVDRLRNVELAKRNQKRLENPSAFPKVPADDL